MAGFKETSGAAFATEIFKPLLRAIIAFIILWDITYVFEWIIEPFVNLTDGLTATVLVDGDVDTVADAHFPASDYLKWTAEIDIPNDSTPPDDTVKAINLEICKDLKKLLGEGKGKDDYYTIKKEH